MVTLIYVKAGDDDRHLSHLSTGKRRTMGEMLPEF